MDHGSNPSTQEMRQEACCEFKAILGYRRRPNLEKLTEGLEKWLNGQVHWLLFLRTMAHSHVPGDLAPSSGLCGHCIHVVHTYTHTFTYIHNYTLSSSLPHTRQV